MGFNEFLYREYSRASKGEKIIEEVAGKRFVRESVMAVKCEKELLTPFGYKGTCDANLLKTLLVQS